VPTPPGSNKPAGLPEDTALIGNRPRIAPAHPSPGGTTVLGNNHLTAGGVNILAPAELSKMFPTPPSHEYPMQSPCGQMEGLVDGVGDMNSNGGLQNGVKSEPGMNGCSPTYLQEDVNKVKFLFFLIYSIMLMFNLFNVHFRTGLTYTGHRLFGKWQIRQSTHRCLCYPVRLCRLFSYHLLTDLRHLLHIRIIISSIITIRPWTSHPGQCQSCR